MEAMMSYKFMHYPNKKKGNNNGGTAGNMQVAL